MRPEIAAMLRAAARGPLLRKSRGKTRQLQDRLLRLGWLEPDPARPGYLALTMTGSGELPRLLPKTV